MWATEQPHVAGKWCWPGQQLRVIEEGQVGLLVRSCGVVRVGRLVRAALAHGGE